MYFEDGASPSYAEGLSFGGMGPRRRAVRSSIFGHTLSARIAPITMIARTVAPARLETGPA